MTQNLNQFGQTPVQGQLDLQSRGGSVFTGQVSSAQVTALIPGQAVKIEDSAGGVQKLLSCADTDQADGFVIFTLKDQNFPTLKYAEFALFGSVMYMTSNAAIARNGRVEVRNSDQTVGPAGGINPVVGWAMDKATATGQLIRIFITTEAQSGQAVKNVSVTATLAQINAGLVLIPGSAGKKINVTNFTAKVLGTFLTGTAVVLESTNASPVVIGTEAAAGLTTGATITPADANMTLGAGFAAPLGTGDGVQVVKTGSSFTGGTSITFNLTYTQA